MAKSRGDFIRPKKPLPKLAFGDFSMGKPKTNTGFADMTTNKAKAAAPKGKDRFASASPDIKSSALKAPKGPEKGKMGTEYKAPKRPSNLMAKGASPKPAKGVSSGSIDKPTPNSSAAKSRADLGAFYLNATQHMDIHSRKKKK